MASIPNTAEASFGDGQTVYVNVDTLNKILGLWNGMSLKFYSDAGATPTMSLLGPLLALAQSATAPVLANAGTIATAALGVSRVAPAGPVTGIILAAGSQPGQLCLVVNESAMANTIAFNTTPATANVANSATESILPGLAARLFVWDSVQALWVSCGDPLVNGTYVSVQSATSPDPGGNGTIATAGVGVALVTPAASRTGIILAAGTIQGQEVTVVNQAANAVTLTFNTTPATSNVADSANEAAIPGLTARSFVWVGSLWYRQN